MKVILNKNEVLYRAITIYISLAAYEYQPDSEIGIMTGQSGSEEDLLADKVIKSIIKVPLIVFKFVFIDTEWHWLLIRHWNWMCPKNC